MRISDWSSDVCSSDLYYRGDPLLGDWIKRGAMAGAAVVALLVLTILRRGPSLHGRARFAREGEIRREGLRAPSGIRSEEHTSELQSLMRISYAVFCLKKKNICTNMIK